MSHYETDNFLNVKEEQSMMDHNSFSSFLQDKKNNIYNTENKSK